MVRAGDIVLLPFPFTDLSAVKKRPVLVLSDEDSLGDFLALAITSQSSRPSALPSASRSTIRHSAQIQLDTH